MYIATISLLCTRLQVTKYNAIRHYETITWKKRNVEKNVRENTMKHSAN